MSIEMTLRLALLGVIAAVILVGLAMGHDSYAGPNHRRQPVQPQNETESADTGPGPIG
jgi:hypothetical protein